MNPLKKVYCRTYQTIFHMAMPFLPYREPKLLRGIEEMIPIIKGRSIMLVTDAGLRKTGVTQNLEELLKSREIKHVVYDGTRPNPTVKNVEEARELYLSTGCNCIIAFGGGSSIRHQKGRYSADGIPCRQRGKSTLLCSKAHGQ